MVSIMQVTDVMTWHYVFCMGMYRAFYLLNWIWRYMTQVTLQPPTCLHYRFLSSDPWIYQSADLAVRCGRWCRCQEGYSDWIVWVAGIIQTILYLDFFYYYIKCKLDGKNVSLPQ
jgi:ER lumen protein retaining receptor